MAVTVTIKGPPPSRTICMTMKARGCQFLFVARPARWRSPVWRQLEERLQQIWGINMAGGSVLWHTGLTNDDAEIWFLLPGA